MPIQRIHPGIQNISNVYSLNIKDLQNIIIEVKEKEASRFNRNYTLQANIEFAFKKCCKFEFIDCARYLLKTYPEFCSTKNIINILYSICVECSVNLGIFLFQENSHIFDVHFNNDTIIKEVYKRHNNNQDRKTKQLYEFLLFDLKMTISEELKEWIDTNAPDMKYMIESYQLYNIMHKNLPIKDSVNIPKIKI